MKFDEIFPETEFKYREKATLRFPDKNASVMVKQFFQKPPETAEEQPSGCQYTIFSAEREILSFVIKPKEYGLIFYVRIDNEWIELLDEETAEKILEKDRKKVDTLLGKHWQEELDDLLVSAKWESF